MLFPLLVTPTDKYKKGVMEGVHIQGIYQGGTPQLFERHVYEHENALSFCEYILWHVP